MNANTKSASVKTPVNINTVVFHITPHIDEIVAWLLLMWYGESLFPGISKAQKTFSANFPNHRQEFLDVEGILPLGCGAGGLRFNEHNESATGRMTNHCCTTLVMQYLGMIGHIGFKPLGDAVLNADTKNVPATNFGSIVKMSHRFLAERNELVIKALQVPIGAIIKMGNFNYGPVSAEKKLTVILEEILGKKASSYDDERINAHLKKCFAGSEEREDNVLELAFIVKAMYRSGVTHADVVEFVNFVLEIMYTEQRELMACVTECKKVATNFKFLAMTEHGIRTCRGGLVLSNNPHTLAAMLYLRYDAVIVRNEAGLTQINLNKGLKNVGVKSDNVARMFRWFELPVAQKGRLTWQELGVGGTHQLIEHIHYHVDGEAVYNGTLTHPDVKISRIAPQVLVEILQHAFTEKGVKLWKSGRGFREELNNQLKTLQLPKQPKAPKPVAEMPAEPKVAVG